MIKVIGIAGASGSGKTTMANNWANDLCVGPVLSFDSYYHSISPEEDPNTKNFDHPSALDHQLLCEHLELLKAGRRVSIPKYDFRKHSREGVEDFKCVEKCLLVEGILLLHFESIREHLDVSVFIDTPFDVCVERRLQRDCVERGRGRAQAIEQIRQTVEPMYLEYVRKSIRHADLVLQEESTARDHALTNIKSMLDL